MIQEDANGVCVMVRINTQSGRFRIYKKSDRLVVDIKNRPEKGKANAEIAAKMGKMLGKDVGIVKGFKSRDKTILIRNVSKEEFLGFLDSE